MALISAHSDAAADWREFRPRPANVSLFQMLYRLFWNPAWNESLFLVSCAERIEERPTEHSINEIRRRILREIMRIKIETTDKVLQFRLVFVHRNGTELEKGSPVSFGSICRHRRRRSLTLDFAMRATEILLALAFLQQAADISSGQRARGACFYRAAL